MKKAQRSKATTTTSRLIKPPALKEGDVVGLVCPSSRPASPAVLQRCVRIVEEMGYKPKVGAHVLAINGYMAGSDQERLADLQGFLTDDSVRGIFCLSGGFGSLHLVPLLNYSEISGNPKIIVGSDDNSHLLFAVLSQANVVTFHGPNLDQLSTRYAFDRFKDAVSKKSVLKELSPADISGDEIGGGRPYTPVTGTAHGALLGGNLTALISLMGTPYQPEFLDSILFLEDRNERTDILDRWFTTLYVAGELERASAVVFGDFVNCGPKGSYDLLSLEELFGDRLKQINKPSCFGLPLGQTGRSATVPLGMSVSLDAAAGVLQFAEMHLS